MRPETTNNVSYSTEASESSISISIPTSIYKQKEARLIIIQRDALQIRIQDFFAHFVEWGTTISLIIAFASMLLSAIVTYNDHMQGKDILVLIMYTIFTTIFLIMTCKSFIKHFHHWGKSVYTLMTDIDKACDKPTLEQSPHTK